MISDGGILPWMNEEELQPPDLSVRRIGRLRRALDKGAKGY